MLLFHGCGGVQGHLDDYARAAASAGVRAFVIDSYAPRGWGRAHGLTLVCTGLRFWGAERAGDVLAAVHGVTARPDVDADRLGLAGWSHGGWAIMDLMTMALERPGEARLADARPEALAGLRSLSLFYPYVGFGVRSRRQAWRRGATTLGVLAEHDHLGAPAKHRAVLRRVEDGGFPLETWVADGVGHAFDQPEAGPANAAAQRRTAMAELSRARFAAHLRRTLVDSAMSRPAALV